MSKHQHTPTLFAFDPDDMSKPIASICHCGYTITSPPRRVDPDDPELDRARQQRETYLATMRRHGHMK